MKRLFRQLRLAGAVARLASRRPGVWSIAFAPAVLRGLRACVRHRFQPDEAFRLGLFDAPTSPEQHARFVSRRQMTRAQRLINPQAWCPLLTNKVFFHRHAEQALLPAPAPLAVFTTPQPGFTWQGQPLATRADWLRFFDDQLPGDFVVKPVCGSHGHGVHVFARDGCRFHEARGQAFSAEQFYDWMHRQNDPEGLLLAPRLANHPAINELTGNPFLQTLRMITLLGPDGVCRLLHVHFKIIVGPHVTDFYQQGMVGCVQCSVHLDHGTLFPATFIDGTGAPMIVYPTHPSTGRPFDGFAMPFYREARHLVELAAAAFLPIRTVGWDVAITPQGPQLIEGNFWYDPPNQHGRSAQIVAALEQAARQ